MIFERYPIVRREKDSLRTMVDELANLLLGPHLMLSIGVRQFRSRDAEAAQQQCSEKRANKGNKTDGPLDVIEPVPPKEWRDPQLRKHSFLSLMDKKTAREDTVKINHQGRQKSYRDEH